MNPITNNLAGQPIVVRAVPLLLTQGEMSVLVKDPERARRDIHRRATEMSGLLNRILREPHGEPDWGLNE